MPILNAALAALNTLTTQDIAIVKTMKTPAAGIRLVMEAICIIKDVKPDRKPNPSGVGMIEDYWSASLRVLGDINFLASLINFDKDNIPPKIIQTLKSKILNDPLFDPDKIKTISTACEGLCKWVIAICKYDVVAKVIQPKKAALAIAENAYNTAMDALEMKRGLLRDARHKVAGLNLALQKEQDKLKILNDDADLCNKKLQRAEDLIGGLGGEKARWNATANTLSQRHDGICGTYLLARCCIQAVELAVYLVKSSGCCLHIVNVYDGQIIIIIIIIKYHHSSVWALVSSKIELHSTLSLVLKYIHDICQSISSLAFYLLVRL